MQVRHRVPPEVQGVATPIDQPPEVYNLHGWAQMDHPQRIAVLRRIARGGANNPRVIETAIAIVRGDPRVWGRQVQGAEARDYEGQARLLLRWVQQHVYYATEAGERIQDPWYTLRHRLGDCDDMAICLASMCMSLRLPVRFVLSGNPRKRSGAAGRAASALEVVRWIEGDPIPKNVGWSHIYVRIGWPPDKPSQWVFAEPTLKGVPLGWDVVQHHKRGGGPVLPELSGPTHGLAVRRGPQRAGPRRTASPLSGIGAVIRPHVDEFKAHIKSELSSPGKIAARLALMVVFGLAGVAFVDPVIRGVVAPKKKTRTR